MAREYYSLEESPQYEENVEKLLNTDPVLAESGFFYNLLLKILNNIKAVYQRAVPISRTVNGKALSSDVTITKEDIGLGNVENTTDSTKTVASAVSADTAAQLTTARTIQTNLASTEAVAFNGTADIAVGVTGVLPVANGGTGATSLSSITVGKAASASTLTTARTVRTNLASTTAASFNGSANITPGVTGTLPVANGGTGATSLASITVGKSNACNGLTFGVQSGTPTSVVNNKITFSY